MSVPQIKRQMRRECFARVKQLTPQQRSHYSESVCEQIANLVEFKNAKTVFAFLPLITEPDLNPLFLGNEKSWAFSHVLTDTQMEFRIVNPTNFHQHLVKGEFGILEPKPQHCPIVSPECADLVLIPGVGFCQDTGNRLGRGKGHYDRYLEQLAKARGSLPPLIGVCFAEQLVNVPTEGHDVPMNRVVFP